MIIAVSGLTEDEQGNRGSAGAGKSEVAKRLVEKHGFVEIAFADEIKRMAMRLWDFTEEQLWGPSELRNIPDRRYPSEHMKGIYQLFEEGKVTKAVVERDEARSDAFLTPRRALQILGTEVARSIDKDVWVRFALKMARQLLAGEGFYQRTVGLVLSAAVVCKGVVISDLRYKNEMVGVREADGKCWRKKRNVLTLAGHAGKHTSETGLLDVPDSEFDGVFPGGDLHHLGRLIDSVMDHYTGRIIPYDPEQADIPPFKRK